MLLGKCSYNSDYIVQSLIVNFESSRWSATFSADCPELQPGIGALASSRDTAFGTLVSFTCPIGQEFATGKTRLVTECLRGGNWSVSYIPKCQGECGYL